MFKTKYRVGDLIEVGKYPECYEIIGIEIEGYSYIKYLLKYNTPNDCYVFSTINEDGSERCDGVKLHYSGEIKDLPESVVLEMLDEQERQGNKRDVSVFEKDRRSTVFQGGFRWSDSVSGIDFWMSEIGETTQYSECTKPAEESEDSKSAEDSKTAEDSKSAEKSNRKFFKVYL